MNQAALPVLSVVLSLAAAIGVSFALRPTDAAPDAGNVAALQKALDTLRSEHEALRAKVEAAKPAPAAAAPASLERTAAPALANEQVAELVEAYLAKRGAGGGKAPAAGDGAAATFDVEAEFASLQGTNFFNNAAAWQRAFRAGKMEDVIKKFEALAKANPTDAKAQMQLASAYLAYVNMDQSKYQYSMKADQVFDKVLEQDEHHWEARFTKAVSYTFWPDFLGKKKEAISHFETLVAQQDTMPPQAHEAQTYLYLGNMLQSTDPAKAREVWAKGARRHPDNQELAKKLKP